MISILHVVDLPGSNPWLNGVAVHHDRKRFRHMAVSLGTRNGLHDALEQHGLRVFALDAQQRAKYPIGLARLVWLLRRERPDIVQTHLFAPSIIGLLAAKVARTPLKIVTRHHADFTTIFQRPIHRRIDRWQALAADKVMAASEAVKQAMIQYEQIPEERISVARYGYDFTHLRPTLTTDERREIRDSLGGHGNYLVGAVSRLSVEKGHQYLLQAMPRIVKTNPRVRLLLIGTGPLKEELERSVHDLGLGEHIRFLGWRSDACRLMEAMDLMVHPTLHEAFCSVIIESMALGRPLVATDVAAAPEQIDHGESGMLVPARSPDRLADAVLTLMHDRDGAERMGEEGRRRVNERFNFPRMMGIYEEYYTKWLDEKLRSRVT